ncbi:aspartate aminotransferase family protein [Clostridiaceae bacterium]|nr:aspartate aminotransferase family protein [Clostridiaceae bacterium]RKI17909.1 aspartate aminotransferase family protein [bacterium 1XD21-70]
MENEYLFRRTPKEVKLIHTKNREICTKIPVPESMEIIERSLKNEPWSMNHQLYAVWDHATDFHVYDKWGNKWIDLSSGIFVTNTGHGNPEMVKALEKMIQKPMLNSYYYFLEERSLLTEQLAKMAPEGMDKVFLLTTGAETTECALKLCRLHGIKQDKKKLGMIAFNGAFHGKTLGAQTMAGKPNSWKWIGNLDPCIYHLPCPTDPFEDMAQIYDEDKGRKLFERDIKELEASGVDLDTIAGAIFEPYQGWAALFYPIGYIKALREFLTEKGALLVSDEVQAGFGRTGKLFGYEYYGVDVDIICCGKAISGALPLSAVLSSAEILDVDGSLNSTHGGSPLPCASALANLKYLEEHHLVNESKRKEKILLNKFNELKKKFPDRVKTIHGMGMAFAAVVVKPGTKELDVELVDRIIERAFEKGVMSIRTMTGTIKVGPPLTISDEALKEGMEVLIESMEEIIEEDT